MKVAKSWRRCSSVGFEVFRFEGDQTVEHWDNIQARLGPNLSGHSMVSGEAKSEWKNDNGKF